MGLFRFNDIGNLVDDCYNNPYIWVKSDFKYHKKILSPSSLYVDDDGDIVIEVPCDFLTEEYSE